MPDVDPIKTEAVRNVLATAFPGAEIQVQDLGRAVGVVFDLALPEGRTTRLHIRWERLEEDLEDTLALIHEEVVGRLQRGQSIRLEAGGLILILNEGS